MSRPDPLPVRRAANLEAASPEARWLVEALWPEAGVGLIGGTPKSCKTWLGLEMATAVATGTPCLGRFGVARAGPVLAYLAEDGAPVVRERLEALAASRDRALADLDVRIITSPSLRLDRRATIQRLDVTLGHHEPRLLLLDPLVRLHRADENSAQEIAAILADLRDLQRRHDVAIVLVHHTRKNGRTGQPGQSLRGSGDLHAWGDANLYLTHRKKNLKLTVEHRAAPAPDPFHVRLVGPPPRLEIVEPASEKAPSLDERALEALRQAPEPVTRTDLRARLRVRNSRLGDALNRLEKLGRIERTSSGWQA